MMSISWVALGVSVGVAFAGAAAWYRMHALREEAERLRSTLNAWHDEERGDRLRAGEIAAKLEELEKLLRTTEDARARAEARARKAEARLAVRRKEGGDQELRAHVAMLSAERDALKDRVRDLTDALRRS